MKFTKKAFIAWLEMQSPQRRFRGKSCNTCPIARFTGSDTVGVHTWIPPGKEREVATPEWMENFIQRFDGAVGRKQVGAARVLEILRS